MIKMLSMSTSRRVAEREPRRHLVARSVDARQHAGFSAEQQAPSHGLADARRKAESHRQRHRHVHAGRSSHGEEPPHLRRQSKLVIEVSDVEVEDVVSVLA
jgi:hypothetical protein